MDNTILDFSDTLAKWRLVENDSKISALLDAATREAHRLDVASLVELTPVPVPVPVPVASRRQRKRSLSKVCEAARKAGADRIVVDGVVIYLTGNGSSTAPAEAANPWDSVLPDEGDAHGPH